MKLANATTGQLIRLDSIADYLKLASDPAEPSFADEAVEAVLQKVKPIVNAARPEQGESVVAAIANHYGVRFEEVRSPGDVHSVKRRYLNERGELGFGMIDAELANPQVDALLFQLTQVPTDHPEKFIAVLNLQDSPARGYWNRSHELSHRLAEPPQRLLPFKRHRFEAANPVEKLVDQIAGEIAFYAPIFGPIVSQLAKDNRLTLPVVKSIQTAFAPTSSLLAVVNAVVKHWPCPAIAIEAAKRGRRGRGNKDVALRVKVQARNVAARDQDLLIWNNMRVPPSSPLYSAFSEERLCEDSENLDDWTTSTGRTLSSMSVLTSAIGFNGHAYAVIST